MKTTRNQPEHSSSRGLTLPADTGAKPVLRHLAMPHKGAYILLAEDNPVNRDLTRAMLNRLGYVCDCCDSGAQVLEAISKNQYDLILMDCQMPEMDGYAATASVREREDRANASARIPIVALTAHAMPGDRERCLAAGMDDYLTKPFTVKELAQMLTQWFGKESNAESEGVEPMSPSASGDDAGNRLDDSVVIARCSGSRELARKLLRAFVKQTGEDLTALAEAAAEGDTEQLVRAAHRLKGAAGNLGLDACSQSADRIDQLGQAGRTDGVEPLLELLRNEVDQITRMKLAQSED